MRGSAPDFIESLARGLDALRAFDSSKRVLTLSEVATRTGLARPTARRILVTLDELGYVRGSDGGFELTAKVLDLGMAYISSSSVWDVAHPHLVELVKNVHESCSIAQLDGSDIVYVARVAVPKLVTLSVTIGTRFPALQTSLGKVLLAGLPEAELKRTLAIPSLSPVKPAWQPDDAEIAAALREVRARGWAATDQQLAPAIRSVAAPVRGSDGQVVAAMNVNAHAMETSMETLIDEVLPRLLVAASAFSDDWARWEGRPLDVVDLTQAGGAR